MYVIHAIKIQEKLTPFDQLFVLYALVPPLRYLCRDLAKFGKKIVKCKLESRDLYDGKL